MLARLKDGVLQVRSVDGAVHHEVALGDLRAISSLRLDPRGTAIALTAIAGEGREPDVMANQRGDLRLYVVDLATGTRRCLTKTYAHDGTWWPDGSRIAYHTGRGIAVVRSSDGGEEHRHEIGRFGWGAPSISVSPSGTRVAFVKWKGDDRKIAVYDLTTSVGSVHRPSCYRYAWWSDDVIGYSTASTIKRLDVTTGKTRAWLDPESLLSKVQNLDALLPGARDLPPSALVQLVDPVCFDGRVYARLHIATTEARSSAVISVSEGGHDLRVHAASNDQKTLGEFFLLNGARTIAVSWSRQEGGRLVEQGVFYAGEYADEIPEGFGPAPTLPLPAFGFHALPS